MTMLSVATGPSHAAYTWAAQGGGFGNQTVVDKVPSDMLHMIDPHWYQFPPMNPLWHAMLGFIIGVLGIISIIGNGMVVYIFTTTKSLRTPSNLLVVNLAISDFLMMLCMSPAMVINCYYETWVLGPFFCELYALTGSLFGCGSIWTMTMIAFDRYNVIVKGLSAKPMSINGALIRIFALWLFSLAWTLAPLFGWNRYFFIIQAVAAHEKNMREQAKKMNVASLRSAENQNTSAECKLAKVALMTISLWFMAWTPYLVINYAGIFETTKISPLFTIWGSVFAKANAVYNPIVYGISHPKYRAALFQRFPSLACASESAPGADATSTITTVTEGEKSAA